MTEPRNPLPVSREAATLGFALLTTSLMLVGCASKPFSQLDGQRWNTAELNTFDTKIVSIDGESQLAHQNSRLLVEPGRHHIVFQTSPAPGFRYSPQEALDLDVKPCTRYWFEAKRVNAIEQHFEPRVNYEEPIGGCAVASSASSY